MCARARARDKRDPLADMNLKRWGSTFAPWSLQASSQDDRMVQSSEAKSSSVLSSRHSGGGGVLEVLRE